MKNVGKITIIIILTFSVFSINVLGSEMKIMKSINQDKINVNEPLNVTLTIENNGIYKIDGRIADFYPPFARVIGRNMSEVGFVPKITWNFTLDSKESKNFSYLLDFSGIPHSYSGRENVTIPVATLKYDNRETKSGSLLVHVFNITKRKNCNSNFECEPEIGENSETCISDCPIGGKDGRCDPAKDTICDPDCNGTDLDCLNGTVTTSTMKTTTTSKKVKENETCCGNDICEKGEDQNSCPKDCATGFPYYIIWIAIAIIIVILSIMIIYQSKRASGDMYG